MPEYGSLFVCLMGMGTVFFGLICLIVLTTIMGKIVGGRPAPAPPAPVSAAPPAPAGKRHEIAAADSPANAEELGTSITGIRIVSMKKL